MASSKFSSIFTDNLVQVIQKKIDTANSTGARVTAWDQIQELMLQHKVAWVAQVPPDFCDVHPMNRSKLGVGGLESHTRGMQILQSGFSWKKAADAAVVEAKHDDREAWDANERFVHLSGGFIPPLQQLKLLSVEGAHTNAFLRAVKAGCKSAVPKLADDEGNLNMQQLIVDRPEFKEAVEQGLKWFVMHHEAPAVWPGLVHMVQAALNTHAKSDQSEVEVMLDIHNMYEAALTAGTEVDWKSIQNTACFSMPPCSPYIGVLVSFVKAHGGGSTGELLQELSKYQAAFRCSGILGSEFLGRLSSISFGVGLKYPWLVIACVKANLSSPPAKVVDGICKMIPVSSIAILASKNNRELVKEAESMLLQARSLCESIPGITDHTKVTSLGRLDVRVVMFIMKRIKDIEPNKVITCLDDISKVPSHHLMLPHGCIRGVLNHILCFRYHRLRWWWRCRWRWWWYGGHMFCKLKTLRKHTHPTHHLC